MDLGQYGVIFSLQFFLYSVQLLTHTDPFYLFHNRLTLRLASSLESKSSFVTQFSLICSFESSLSKLQKKSFLYF